MTSNKRLKIVMAARDVFTRYGYKRVNMNDVAQAAGISRAALYLLFKKKEDLFRAAIKENGQLCRDEVTRQLPSVQGDLNKVRLVFEIWIVRAFEMVIEMPDAADFFDHTTDFAHTEREANWKCLEASLVPLLDSALNEADATGWSAEDLAHTLACAVRGYKYISRTSGDLRRLVDNLLELTAAAIQAQRKAA